MAPSAEASSEGDPPFTVSEISSEANPVVEETPIAEENLVAKASAVMNNKQDIAMDRGVPRLLLPF